MLGSSEGEGCQAVSAGESQLPLHGWQEAQAASSTESAVKPPASPLLGSGHFWGNLLTCPWWDMPEVGFQPENPLSCLAHHQRLGEVCHSTTQLHFAYTVLMMTLPHGPFQSCSIEITFASFTQTLLHAHPTSRLTLQSTHKEPPAFQSNLPFRGQVVFFCLWPEEKCPQKGSPEHFYLWLWKSGTSTHHSQRIFSSF